MRVKISLTLLGMIVSVTGLLALIIPTPMNIQTADAKENCKIGPDSLTCAGGSGRHDEFGMGGSGGRFILDSDGFESSGGSGGVNLDTAEPEVGGEGHHGGCENFECDFDGGNGRHVRGEGNND